MQATVLSISGSDPTGGAGIQADLKTMTSIGVYGAAAVTCITVQSSHGVVSINCLPPDQVRQQIKVVMDDHRVTHVKIGMVGTMAIAEAIHDALSDFKGEIIYDPVMISSTGQPLREGIEVNEFPVLLVSQCTVLTPNIPELSHLSKVQIEHHHEALHHAEQLLSKYNRLRAILVKGGHAIRNAAIVDTMVYRTENDIRTMSISHSSVKTQNTHGTGCTLASAFASFHCLCGDDIQSFQQSVDYVQTVLRNSAPMRIIRNPEGLGGMLHFSFRSENRTC